jgi:SAM-dependent methyltransferase
LPRAFASQYGEPTGGIALSQHADLKRYELFGWDYAAVNPLTEAEVAWHVMWARRAGPPVLVLACGTGRLACELARAGFPTVGLDLCDAMLALAAEQAAQLPPDAGARVRFVRGDMADFDLGEQFGLVCIPDNSLRELPARQRIVSCLACIRRHVRPDGVALVT